MYFYKSLLQHPKGIHQFLRQWPPAKKLIFIALMATLAVVLQSAGGLLPGIGYFFSPFATAPILLGALISFRSGVMTYLVTICLLFIIQPSELVIFPFTTGLLGLGLAWTFRVLKGRFRILISNALLLFLGICIPLYGFGFPVFGPIISSNINVTALLIIIGFSLVYCLLWIVFGLFLLRKIKVMLGLQ
ncbi:hypothetical protein [Sporosarcina sp. JAI121]|uniref:hypothetical protein n=1 Tax=Sporosarcina sp. JAI121 TaxID=2723064 RepID=UPI0015CAFFF7|nr:hypothetical protein [Sporosarcina sp. JAI121]NYF26355.1 membrane-associated HD superfamily phosphohydrolase [Sporosarcina sp. JAI121]